MGRTSGGRAPRLLPRPREIELGDEGLRGDAGAADWRADPGLPREGYALSVDRDGVRVRYADANGQRYAHATLAQLRRQLPDGLPGLRIRDWPDFAVRGYMLDVSRDRVPTRATLERIVGLLGLCRLNQLQLYTEHTFAYRDHETVWREASPITADDVHWLDALCREHGVELVANQNGFGHMGRWLRHAAYRERAEAPDGWDAPWGRRMQPAVLAPSAENAAFVLGLMRELLSHFTSRRINIGCDETFELGQGRSRRDVESRGRGHVYLEFLQRLLDGLHADGCEVLFWGDIVRQHPELIPDLPRQDTVALVWHYEAPVRGEISLSESARRLLGLFGLNEETLRGFSAHVAPFAEHGYPYWVCPGTSTWNTLIGRLPNALGNLRDAAEVGLARGAGGYLVTDWGDNGHMAPPSVSFGPLAYGAAVSWCQETNRDLDVGPLLDEFVFEDEAGELGAALTALGSAYAGTGLHTPNGSPLQYALLRGHPLSRLVAGQAEEAGVLRVLEELGETADRIARARPLCADGAVVQRELAQAVRLARHGAWRIARGAGFARPSDAELRRDLLECIEEQRTCWLERSRPGGLEDSLALLQPALEDYAA
jgi:hypothetical protein